MIGMTVADHVIDFLVKKGITDIFLVSGGGIMYLLDAIYRNKKIKYISNYHEQASAIAAEGYARVKNKVGACLVTTGPGSTNAVTGVAGAYVESIPMVVISGQVKRETIADYNKLRQLGVQEINIIDIVKPITKYAVTVLNPRMSIYELEKAWHKAITDRPGPVWINIPLDVQGIQIDKHKLQHYKPPVVPKSDDRLKYQVKKATDMLSVAKRPLLITGLGIRIAHGEDELDKFLSKFKLPVVHSVGGLDLVPDSYLYKLGMFGPSGQRRANFAVQNADLLLSIGAGLDINETGFNFKDFARNAKKIAVNIDEEEMRKPNVYVDMAIRADAAAFMKLLLNELKNTKINMINQWLYACQKWKKDYPTVIPEFYKNKKYVNSYVLMDILSDLLSSDDVLTTGIGMDVVSFYSAFKIKKGQRAFANKHFGGMGWCLPLAIGACVGNRRKQVICVTGDGSFQFNIQELNTINNYRLPIKIFVFNNQGYKSIRDTQNNFFQGRLVGADKTSGVLNPDFKKLAETYNLRYEFIRNNIHLKNKIKKILKHAEPILCEVNVDPKQERVPRSVTYRDKAGNLQSRPLEDLAPLLPREELEKNMNIFNTNSKFKGQK